MFKSVICVGEDFTVDLTGPVYRYWCIYKSWATIYYKWDGVKLLARTTGSLWVDACASYNDVIMQGTPCDANTAEVPTEYIARLQQSN